MTRPRSIINSVPHAELHVSSRTGELIRIRCFCAIAHDHTYQDWRQATRPPAPGTPRA